MDRLAFTVPGQPVGKGRPRFVRSTGHSFTPAKTRTYEGIVATFAIEAMRGHPPFEGACSVEVVAYFQIPASWSGKKKLAAIARSVQPTGRPDSDNLLKAVCDSCNGIVWRDDSQATDCRVVKRYAMHPRVEVSIVHLAAAERGVVIHATEKAA